MSTTIRRVQARLAYDSTQARPEGARGFAHVPRMLLYRWESLTVDLLLRARPEICVMHGQVTYNQDGRPVTGAETTVGTTRLATDDHGEFVVTLDDDWAPRAVCIRKEGVEVVCTIPGS